MKLFDPHIHMSSRTTADYEAMAAAGIVAIVEPAFWLGQPRTHVGTFEDYFASLLGWEPFRASQFGIRHFCTLALNPKEADYPRSGWKRLGRAKPAWDRRMGPRWREAGYRWMLVDGPVAAPGTEPRASHRRTGPGHGLAPRGPAGRLRERVR